jgi:hypothetical protein
VYHACFFSAGAVFFAHPERFCVLERYIGLTNGMVITLFKAQSGQLLSYLPETYL